MWASNPKIQGVDLNTSKLFNYSQGAWKSYMTGEKALNATKPAGGHSVDHTLRETQKLRNKWSQMTKVFSFNQNVTVYKEQALPISTQNNVRVPKPRMRVKELPQIVQRHANS